MTDKALQILQEIEREYGSVANVPEGNRKLSRLQALMESEHRNRRDSYNTGQKQKGIDFINDIIKYRDKGYNTEQIIEATGRSDAYTRSIMRKNGIKTLPFYNYSVTDSDGNTMYFKSQQEVMQEMGVSKRLINDTAKYGKRAKAGYVYRAIRPIAVGLPPEVLIKKKGKWIRAKNL